MATIFLLIIYMSFISLGLPDSLLGVAWPVMRPGFGLPLEAAGAVSMTIAVGTILSSLVSGHATKLLGTGKVVLGSCILTAGALMGYSLAPGFGWVVALAVPLGFGGGAVDAALNSYVAAHYKAHHMSWLHSFWGVGATLGPVVMAAAMGSEGNWRMGYRATSLIQFGLVLVLLLSLPLWAKMEKLHHKRREAAGLAEAGDGLQDQGTAAKGPLQVPGVKFALASFLFYCGAETTMGLWGSSFLVQTRGLAPETAARWVSFYYGGIMLGRFLTGFLTFQVSSRRLVRAGQAVAILGAAALLLPLPPVLLMGSFVLMGLGYAPVFPGMIHETPRLFGWEHSPKIIGYQMAFAYVGVTFFPPLFGWIAARTDLAAMPVFLLACLGGLAASQLRLSFIDGGRNGNAGARHH
ncbi:MFS transporter [Anaerotalea alkaliphila]|uniref:MFS transporter n=1 Tax=Anaerotalea alkaliphila TaxID=2662126 RepID=A0A7X5KNZ6_9FIRM|nr:MFS transporter [Anaerotalea alkaliphila]NDL67277.1 MFS transporter [Anaerotalea alkaliphila]